MLFSGLVCLIIVKPHYLEFMYLHFTGSTRAGACSFFLQLHLKIFLTLFILHPFCMILVSYFVVGGSEAAGKNKGLVKMDAAASISVPGELFRQKPIF